MLNFRERDHSSITATARSKERLSSVSTDRVDRAAWMYAGDGMSSGAQACCTAIVRATGGILGYAVGIVVDRIIRDLDETI